MIYPILQWRRCSLRCALGLHDMQDDICLLSDVTVVISRHCRHCHSPDQAYNDSPEGKHAQHLCLKWMVAPYRRDRSLKP